MVVTVLLPEAVPLIIADVGAVAAGVPVPEPVALACEVPVPPAVPVPVPLAPDDWGVEVGAGVCTVEENVDRAVELTIIVFAASVACWLAGVITVGAETTGGGV